ncbi:MAG TPA: hypothetical protein PK079_10995 [Leptospiraceae bacterium]|nr:hypothetical protein [Leptospiraceae bacterium]HMW07437.1 hypothetical protein [Leptospiraceae bacterium]HMX32200.1 hypothetical protein [Leptospiraceae bacterium]HMY33016.1 hypothetical protein [Leptospiraceae bacterium]HMZ63526.1 hypothetical protein [Leptospiraceae bacterium]
MKRILFPLLLLLLLVFTYWQDLLYSPLTPKASAIAHFKISPKLLAKQPPKNQSPYSSSASGPSEAKDTPVQNLTEEEIRAKHGRLELVRLIDNSFLKGVVIEQGTDFIRVETNSGIKKIMTENVDTVEIIR